MLSVSLWKPWESAFMPLQLLRASWVSHLKMPQFEQNYVTTQFKRNRTKFIYISCLLFRSCQNSNHRVKKWHILANYSCLSSFLFLSIKYLFTNTNTYKRHWGYTVLSDDFNLTLESEHLWRYIWIHSLILMSYIPPNGAGFWTSASTMLAKHCALEQTPTPSNRYLNSTGTSSIFIASPISIYHAWPKWEQREVLCFYLHKQHLVKLLVYWALRKRCAKNDSVVVKSFIIC